MKAIRIQIISIAALLLLAFCVTAADLTEWTKATPESWRARLLEKIWWYEQENDVARLQLEAVELEREVGEFQDKYDDASKRHSEDAKLIKEVEARIKKIKAEIARDKPLGIDVTAKEATVKTADTRLARLKTKHADNTTRKAAAKKAYDDKLKAYTEKKADIDAWVKREPNAVRGNKEANPQFFNDTLEMYEHIEHLLRNYMTNPGKKLTPAEMALLKSLSAGQLRDGLQIDPNTGQFKDALLEDAFKHPEGAKVLMEQLRNAANTNGLSEADRAATMKLLAKALWNTTHNQGAYDHPEIVDQAKAHFSNLIKQKCFVSSDLTNSYRHFINTNPTKSLDIGK